MAAHNAQQVDPREADLVEAMILDSMEYIHGKGSKKIVEQLDKSADTSKTMATIAYKVVRGVAEKNKATSRVEMDMDMLMGVATEAIDMITEVAQAANQLGSGAELTRVKEDTLLKLTMMHGEQLGEIQPEMRDQASTDLRDYMSDGGTQKAFNYINTRAKAEGLNPNDIMRTGNEAATGFKDPLRDPLAEGISNGLMSQADSAAPPPQVPGEQPLDSNYPPAPLPQDPAAAPAMMQDVAPLPTDNVPPNTPYPLPTGEGLVPSGYQTPPPVDPNAAILPPGTGRR